MRLRDKRPLLTLVFWNQSRASNERCISQCIVSQVRPRGESLVWICFFLLKAVVTAGNCYWYLLASTYSESAEQSGRNKAHTHSPGVTWTISSWTCTCLTGCVLHHMQQLFHPFPSSHHHLWPSALCYAFWSFKTPLVIKTTKDAAFAYTVPGDTSSRHIHWIPFVVSVSFCENWCRGTFVSPLYGVSLFCLYKCINVLRSIDEKHVPALEELKQTFVPEPSPFVPMVRRTSHEAM